MDGSRAVALETKPVPFLNVQEQAFWSDVDLDKHACCKGTLKAQEHMKEGDVFGQLPGHA